MKKLTILVMVALLALLVSCAAPEPETVTIIETVTVIETVEVVKEGETVIETVEVVKEGETVIETVEVVKEVEVEVTAMPEPEVEAEPVTITWWHISTDENHMALWQSMADAYTAEHPNVTIDITVLENEAFKTKMTTVMQSGEPPDIFQSWGGGVLNEYADAGLMLDITPYLDEGGWRETFSPGALGVYANQGKNYGVPWDMGMVGFWYNKALFAEAGIEAPPTTWTELLEDIQLLKDAGITPIALGGGDKWPAMFWWAYLATRIGGEEGFNAAYTRTGAFTDPAFVQAGEMIQQLVALEPFQDGFLGATYGDQATATGNSKAAMELMGQWAPSVQNGNSESGEGLGEDLGFFIFPMVEGGAGDPADAFGGGNGFGLGINASPEAVDFVKFLTHSTNQTSVAALNIGLPVVKGAEVGVTDPLLKQVQEGAAAAKYFQLYYDQALPPAVGSVVNDSVQALFAGTMTPEEAAQAVDDSYVQEIE